MLANIFLGNLWRKFVLKKALVTRYHNHNGKTVTGDHFGNGDVHSKPTAVDFIPCYRCQKRLTIGQEVWSHPTQCKTKYYCEGCYGKLWL